MNMKPGIAIVDSNTLSALGLKHLLEQVIPIMDVQTFSSFEAFEGKIPDSFYHYFITQGILISHRQFFYERRHKTIVLTMGGEALARHGGFHSLSVNVPEETFVRSLLMLEQHAHAHGKNLPPMPKSTTAQELSDREIEVLRLIVEGYINKEVADRLNIGLTTVITHRKNIMTKLGVKSVSALTIYAVTHGYVDINNI